MKILYIDVYFLINFTVDLLSLYFAAVFSKIQTNTRRLILSSLLGALIAVFIVFLPEVAFMKMLLAGLGLLIMALIVPKRVSMYRRAKYAFSFLIFQALTGGGVTLIWNIFDKFLSVHINEVGEGVVNRKMLVFSAIILLSIGVFKMLVSFFSNVEQEKCVEVEINFLGKIKKLYAFVDSGNLAIDPMDMSPVLLLKRSEAQGFLPDNVIDLTDPDLIDRRVRRRIRLIPVTRGGTTHLLTGVKVDGVKVVCAGREEEIRVTVAIDKEGGNYGGYSALMPSAALDDVL